jgi:hypothetical protein
MLKATQKEPEPEGPGHDPGMVSQNTKLRIQEDTLASGWKWQPLSAGSLYSVESPWPLAHVGQEEGVCPGCSGCPALCSPGPQQPLSPA